MDEKFISYLKQDALKKSMPAPKIIPKKPLVLTQFRREMRGPDNVESIAQGYRYGKYLKNERQGWYEVFWQTVSGHYVILEDYRNSGEKHSDTCPLEVREGTEKEDSIDGRCLKLLQGTLIRWGLPQEYVQSAKIEMYKK